MFCNSYLSSVCVCVRVCEEGGTICLTETFKAFSSPGRASARSLNCSTNYHLRVLALLPGLGSPPHPHPTHPPTQPLHLRPGASGFVLACVLVACTVWVCWFSICSYVCFLISVQSCVCVCVCRCGLSWCWGLVKHFLRSVLSRWIPSLISVKWDNMRDRPTSHLKTN